MIGKTVSHYKILSKLGEGGMGVVYKAEATKLKREVALKFLPTNALQGTAEKDRFIREAQAAAAAPSRRRHREVADGLRASWDAG